jgi:tRNA(Ile)-lysidine synthase
VRVEWRIGPLSGTDVVAFDATVLRFPLELRSWQSGDRIRLASGTKKLKKLFVERRVPRSDRHRLPVLADAGGIVVWVPGVDRTSHAEPVPDRPAFHIRVMDGEHG